VLAGADAPVSTTELARRLRITPGGASQHLSALAAAGLVSRRREGREVLYLRTPLAESLLERS
jgi:DNA-binding transcriptional ArsR family regulator